jgi:hypothetical protein
MFHWSGRSRCISARIHGQAAERDCRWTELALQRANDANLPRHSKRQESESLTLKDRNLLSLRLHRLRKLGVLYQNSLIVTLGIPKSLRI